MLTPTSYNVTGATAYCSNQTYNGMKGYLATITTEGEYQYIISTILQPETVKKCWISGNDLSSIGEWVYSSGSPEAGLPFYNVYLDRCSTFCPWGASEPNFYTNQERYVHIDYDVPQARYYYINNDPDLVPIKGLCEFSPDIAFVSPMGDGGIVSISNLKSFNLNSLLVTFVNPDVSSLKFNCTSIVIATTSTITCMIPSNGTGIFNVLIQDGSGKIDQFKNWQYPTPFISSISAPPTLAKSDVISIVGNTFGSDSSNIQVYFTYNYQVQCVNATIVPNAIPTLNFQLFTCQLSATLTLASGGLYPIKLIVDSVSNIAYRTPFLYQNTYYSGFPALGPFTTAMNTFAPKLMVDGLPGRLSVIDTVSKFNFLQKLLPSQMEATQINWNTWIPVSYNQLTSKYYYLVGPNSGKQVTPYWKTGPVSPLNGSTFSISFGTGVAAVSISTVSIGGILEYGGENPSFSLNQTISIPTSGGVGEFKMSNFGTVFSVISVQMALTLVSFTKDYIDKEIDVTIPPGFGGPFSLTVIVDGIPTTPNSSFVTYSPPLIIDADKSPTNGSIITITGNNFYTNASLLLVKFGSDIFCSNIEIVTPHTRIICTMPPGSGEDLLTVSLNGVSSSTGYAYSYISPEILNVSSISPLGGSLTISGSNFNSVIGNVKVMLSTFQLTCTLLTPHTQLLCTNVPANQGNFSLSVNVSSIQSNIYNLQYEPPIVTEVLQTSDYLQFQGVNFGNNFNSLNIFIGSVNIKATCLGNNTYTVCNPIPWNVESNNIIISGSSNDPTPIPFYFNPYISSISKLVLNTTGESMNINGRYFEKQSFGVMVNLSVLDNGFENPQNGYKSNSLLTYQVLPGTGINKILQVVSGNRTSNPVLFSFGKPVIQSVSQNNNILTVSGYNFGNDLTQISISVGLLKGKSLTFTIPHYEFTFQPQNQSVNGDLYLNVSNQYDTYTPINLKPIILSITKPPVDGGQVTVQGYFLSEVDQNGDPTDLQFFFNDEISQCQLLSSPSPFIYSCLVQSGTGTLSSFIINSEEVSDVFQFTYQSPTIFHASSVLYNVGGEVTVSGSNFANTSDLLVTIGTSNCTSPVVLNSTMLTCDFNGLETPTQSPLPVTVVVDGLSGSNNIFVYYGLSINSVLQINDTLLINGSNIGPVSNLLITLNSIDITSVCQGNISYLECGPLPLSVESSGLLEINDYATVPTPSESIQLSPFISEMSNTLFDALGELVTISGRFFEFNNTILLDNGVETLNFTMVDNTTILYDILPRTGKDYILQIKVGNHSSNIIQYSYLPPIIYSLTQNIDILSIVGDNFGIYSSSIQVSYQGIPNPLTIVDVSNELIRVKLLRNLKNGNISLSVSNQSTLPLFLKLKPLIVSISPKPLTTGGLITIQGGYLQEVDSNGDSVKIQINSTIGKTLTCRYLELNQLECNQTAGSGYLQYIAYYDGDVVSTLFPFSYHEPIVQYSTSLFYQQTGFITITGSSFSESNFSITIGDSLCIQPKYLTTTQLSCYFNGKILPAPIGKSLKILINADGLIGENQVFVYYSNKTCANSCSGNGVCNPLDGTCDCNENFISLDCSIQVDTETPSTPAPVHDINANSSIPTGYPTNKLDILISNFREISSTGSPVKLYNISNFGWVERTTISQTSTYYKATYNTIVLEIIISYYQSETSLNFVGTNLNTQPNSLEYQITLSNWPFASATNKLQIILDNKAIPSEEFGACDSSNNIITTSSSFGGSSTQTTWYQIRTGAADFNAVFADRLLLDDSVVSSQLVILDRNIDQLYSLVQPSDLYHLLVAIEVPYFEDSVFIDPNFASASRSQSITCSSSEANNISSDKKSQTWKLAVGLTVGLVGGLALIFAAIYLIKKKILSSSSKLKTLNNNNTIDR